MVGQESKCKQNYCTLPVRIFLVAKYNVIEDSFWNAKTSNHLEIQYYRWIITLRHVMDWTKNQHTSRSSSAHFELICTSCEFSKYHFQIHCQHVFIYERHKRSTLDKPFHFRLSALWSHPKISLLFSFAGGKTVMQNDKTLRNDYWKPRSYLSQSMLRPNPLAGMDDIKSEEKFEPFN